MLPVLAALALAATPVAESPREVIIRGLTELKALATQPEPSIHRLAIRALPLFDVDAMTARAYGAGWSALEPEQKSALTSRVGLVLSYSYAQRAVANAGPPPAIEVFEQQFDNNEASVMTNVVNGTQRVVVVYKLLRRTSSSEWKVVDVVTNEGTLVQMYRAQFVQILAEGGYDLLLSKMEKRRKALEPLGAGLAAP